MLLASTNAPHPLTLSFRSCGFPISVAQSMARWPAKVLGCGAGLPSSTFRCLGDVRAENPHEDLPCRWWAVWRLWRSLPCPILRPPKAILEPSSSIRGRPALWSKCWAGLTSPKPLFLSQIPEIAQPHVQTLFKHIPFVPVNPVVVLTKKRLCKNYLQSDEESHLLWPRTFSKVLGGSFSY